MRTILGRPYTKEPPWDNTVSVLVRVIKVTDQHIKYASLLNGVERTVHRSALLNSPTYINGLTEGIETLLTFAGKFKRPNT